jgi:LacI family transcriptional regulator
MPRRQGEDRGPPRRKVNPRGVRPTINDVARLADVSKKTVSRVINNSPFVRAATRERVGAIIREIGFSPDPQARGLAFRRSFLIGLVCDDPLPPQMIAIQQGILDALRGTGFELIVRTGSGKDAKSLAEIRSFIEGHRLFGVLLVAPLSGERKLIELLRDLGCRHEPIAVPAQASAAAARLIAPTRPSAP